MTPRVMKFGGTSVGRLANLKNALGLVRAAVRQRPVVVVVSALSGVTDELVAARSAALAGTLAPADFLAGLAARHRAHLEGLGATPEAGRRALNQCAVRIAEAQAVLAEIVSSRQCSGAAADALVCLGERLSAPLVAAALTSRGTPAEAVDAASLIVTDAAFGAAEVDFEATRSRVCAWWRQTAASGTVPVVTGFLGATPAGETTILGRGGSDYSAAVLGFALDAERVEIWTDVDGVMSADPRWVPNAFTLRHLSYREAAELAGAGAKVLHPKTMAPLAESGIPILIRNTQRPTGLATRVADCGIGLAHRWSFDARAVAALVDPEGGTTCRLTAVAAGRVGDPPAWSARLREALGSAGIPVLDAPPPPAETTTVAVVVPAQARQAALAVAHDALVRPARRLNLVVAGATGRIGRSFLAELERRPLTTVDGDELEGHLVGVWDGGRFLWEPAGLDPEMIGEALLQVAQAGQTGVGAEAFAATLVGADLPALVVVDATPSAELVAAYPRLLAARVAVVSANPLFHRTDLAEFVALRAAARRGGAPLRYGAALSVGPPGVRAARDLRRSGEPLVALSAMLSASLSFVLARAQAGLPLSQAVAEAEERGLLGSDPWRDLSGEGSAGELVTLLREAGIACGFREVRVTPLVARRRGAALRGAALVAEVAAHDGVWAQRAAAATAAGRRWVYRARFDRSGVLEVAPVELDDSDPLTRLGPGEVGLVYTTGPGTVGCPLMLSGPGASPAAVAGRLLAELAVSAEIAASLAPAAPLGRGEPRVPEDHEAMLAVPHGACF